MPRDSCDECFTHCICFCTGYLVMSIIKVLLTAPFTMPFTSIGVVMSALMLIPHDIYHTYNTIYKSPRFGTNVKILLSILVPITLIIWLILVIVVAIIGSVIGAIAYPVGETYGSICDGNNKNMVSTEVFKVAKDVVVGFWNWNYEAYFVYLEGMKKPYEDGHVFEIEFTQIIVGIVIAIFSMIVDGAFIAVMATVKFIPGAVRLFIEINKGIRELCCGCDKDTCCIVGFCFLPYCVALALIPIAAILVYLVSIISGFFYGINSAIVSYNTGSVLNGIKQTFTNIYVADKVSNESIFGSNKSCLECINFGELGDYYAQKS